MADLIAADMAKNHVTLTATGDVQINAGSKEENKLPTFSFHGYTGEPMNVSGFYHPVIVDLAGAELAEPMTALMNHDDSLGGIVGQGTATKTDGGIFATGTVMSDDAASQKLLKLSENGFKWQASIGANINRREFLDAGKTATVNGREVTGPLIIARESLVHEISFVRRGADSKTSAAVAASLITGKVNDMDPKFSAWLEANEFVAGSLNAKQLAKLEAQFNAETAPAPRQTSTVDDVVARAGAELERQQGIADLTANFLNETSDMRQIEQVKNLAELAISAKWSVDKFDTELLRASRPTRGVFKAPMGDGRINDKVIEAAICAAGRLSNYEKRFDDQTLQAAHDKFKGRISLKQALLVCAEANGYRGGFASEYGLEAHRAAFGYSGQNQIRASFSTLNISTILSATANKFLMEGWNAVDMTPMEIASIRPVSDLKAVTTISLTGDLQYEELGTGGEIKHGKLNELTYTNKAKTYAKMLAITEDDIINDDLGALTAVPRRLGRGAGLKLNDLFWTEFLALVGASFFASGNSNINTGVADMTIGGLTATETIFMAQTDPDGKPLGAMPKLLVVPTALKAAASTLMNSERLITGSTTTQGDGNIFKDRFRVLSSPYISNSSYTGYTAAGWWLLADPAEVPVIEIAAYQGRVEPTVESAQSDFNTLGVQFRGVTRVGVTRQEYRGGVYADGGAS